MGEFATGSFVATHRDLGSALAWLRSLGIKYDVTRFGQYERLIGLYATGSSQEQSKIFKQDRRRLYNANIEADDVVRTYQGLAGKYDEVLATRLRALTYGPEAYTGERSSTASNRGRNVAFELALMAKLANAGIPLDFTIPTDVAAVFQSRTLFFECKRLQSHGSLQARLKEASKQLDQAYNAISRPRLKGLIALDLSKLLNPQMRIIAYRSRGEVEQILDFKLLRFAKYIRETYCLKPRANTLCLILRLRELALVPSQHDNEPYACEVFTFVPLPHISHLSDALLRNLAAALYPMPSGGKTNEDNRLNS